MNHIGPGFECFLALLAHILSHSLPSLLHFCPLAHAFYAFLPDHFIAALVLSWYLITTNQAAPLHSFYSTVNRQFETASPLEKQNCTQDAQSWGNKTAIAPRTFFSYIFLLSESFLFKTQYCRFPINIPRALHVLYRNSFLYPAHVDHVYSNKVRIALPLARFCRFCMRSRATWKSKLFVDNQATQRCHSHPHQSIHEPTKTAQSQTTTRL